MRSRLSAVLGRFIMNSVSGALTCFVIVVTLADVPTGVDLSQVTLPCADELQKWSPATLDEAVARLVSCLGPFSGTQTLAQTEAEYVTARHERLGRAIRNGWLTAPGSKLRQQLIEAGFVHPDDMSGALLSAVWHRAHDRPFDLNSRAECARAWNSESQRLMKSVPRGTQIPPVRFSCEDTARIEAGRRLWPKI
jgi:hypothetical protein